MPKPQYVTADPEVLTEGDTTAAEFVRGEDYEWVYAESFSDFRDEFARAIF